MELADCQRSLGKARELVTASLSEEPSPWAYWITEELVAGEEGRCWMDLRMPHRAQQSLARMVSGDVPSGRDRVLYGAALASAHLAAGDADQACVELLDAVTCLSATSSHRCRGMIDDVRFELSKGQLSALQRTLVDALPPPAQAGSGTY